MSKTLLLILFMTVPAWGGPHPLKNKSSNIFWLKSNDTSYEFFTASGSVITKFATLDCCKYRCHNTWSYTTQDTRELCERTDGMDLSVTDLGQLKALMENIDLKEFCVEVRRKAAAKK